MHDLMCWTLDFVDASFLPTIILEMITRGQWADLHGNQLSGVPHLHPTFPIHKGTSVYVWAHKDQTEWHQGSSQT